MLSTAQHSTAFPGCMPCALFKQVGRLLSTSTSTYTSTVTFADWGRDEGNGVELGSSVALAGDRIAVAGGAAVRLIPYLTELRLISHACRGRGGESLLLFKSELPREQQ